MYGEADVFEAIESARLWSLLAANCPGAEVARECGTTLVTFPYRHPLYNFGCQSSIKPGEEGATIEHVSRFFADRELPWAWQIGPSTVPSDLAMRLVESGFTTSYANPGMILDLAGDPDEKFD